MASHASRIRGQSHAIATLRRALAGGHLHHAWIFHGPFGVGKCTTAIAFARFILDPAVTAHHVARFEPPERTRVAELVASGAHPDLHLIRKECAEDSAIASLRDKKQTNIPVDLLRELMLGGDVDGKSFDAAVWRTPYLGHGKVFIIDEAELLDAVGQNALLKTLEEPPPGTIIILVTTREDRLLPTIRSRCQRVAFRPLEQEAMAEWLRTTELGADGATQAWLERFAEGSPGMAMLAMKRGVDGWARELAKPIAELSRGRFTAGLGDRMAELIGECAESVVKENPRASKEAANRLGARLLFGVLGQEIRDALGAALRADDSAAADRWARMADLLAESDEAVRRNLNLKQVLANLAAQWCARSSQPSGAAR